MTSNAGVANDKPSGQRVRGTARGRQEIFAMLLAAILHRSLSIANEAGTSSPQFRKPAVLTG
jgi:hypothetical protein